MRHDATLDDKIDAKVWKGDDGQCWVWLEGHDGGGYASIWWEGKIRQAYRVIYEHLVGPIPPGWDLDHECHNWLAAAGLCGGVQCACRLCVNPEHCIPKPRGDNLKASVIWRKSGQPNEIAEDYVLPSACPCGFPGGLPTVKEMFAQAWQMGRCNGMIDGLEFAKL